MSEFQKFAQQVHQRYLDLAKNELFITVEDGNELFEEYLQVFPEGTNPIYKERTEHDCSCCKNFIRNIGKVVAIVNGKLESVWSIKNAEHPYDVVAQALDAYVTSRPIIGLFRSSEHQYGAPSTKQLLESGAVKTWNHFHGQVQKMHYTKVVDQVKGNYATTVQVFQRGLEELTLDALDTVIDLIGQKSLYRGEEFLASIKAFRKAKMEYSKLEGIQRSIYAWSNADSPASRFRNSAIGTLIQDLSEGMELEKAVKSFESKVAPANYKRPTALITPRMVQDAMKTIEELDLRNSLERRFAKLSDISVKNVLWVDNSVANKMRDGLEQMLLDAAKVPVKTDVKAEDIAIEDFMEKILPAAHSIEMLVKNAHSGNFMTLTAPAHENSGKLFKWNNDFAWSYSGNIADSAIRQAVQARGGRVDGVFRFSHSWNYDKRNCSLMDLHVFMPGNNREAVNCVHDKYGNDERVGWNHRSHHRSGGVQDVDYTAAAPEGYVPVENITFPDIKRMPEGKYVCQIHNWALREPTKAGFRAEIEFGGQVFQYEHPRPLRNKEWVTVAEVTLKNGVFTIQHHLQPSCASKDVWNVKTETFVKVRTLLHSPNHWDDQAIGNKHYFFILEGCKTDEPVRGIYNEFLSGNLDKHRKVFEILGDKTKCQPTEDQLSGLGFSSTRGDTVTVLVKGPKLHKSYNIKF